MCNMPYGPYVPYVPKSIVSVCAPNIAFSLKPVFFLKNEAFEP